jgi:uncharacterized protein (DUF2237 family)
MNEPEPLEVDDKFETLVGAARRRLPPLHGKGHGWQMSSLNALRVKASSPKPLNRVVPICVTRWKEALEAGVALPVDLEATHSYALEFVSLEELQAHALSPH